MRARNCLLKSFRKPTDEEGEILDKVYQLLSRRDGITVGQLHQQAADGLMDRTMFDFLLEGLARAQILFLATDSFEKEGKKIQFQRAFLTLKGKKLKRFPISDLMISNYSPAKGKKKNSATKAKVETSKAALSGDDLELFKELRDWRRQEAKKDEVPAFCILSDRVMRSIAVSRPKSKEELLQIKGIGEKLFEKYGHKILAVARRE